jgi:S-adenosylmethionine hydrolase
MSIVTLLTDFGISDNYCASLKGMIAVVSKSIRIVDITHNIDTGDIHAAAWILYNTFFTFPENTVHVSIVDPGVGSARDILIINAFNHWFVAPDNGIASLIFQKPYPLPMSIFKTPFFNKISCDSCDSFENSENNQRKLFVPDINTFSNQKVWKLKKEYFYSNISSTFHGRDIFAPLGAVISLKSRREKFLHNYCRPVFDDSFNQEITQIFLFEKGVQTLGSLVGLLHKKNELKSNAVKQFSSVIHIDKFGNIITDIFNDLQALSQGTEKNNMIFDFMIKKDNSFLNLPGIKNSFYEVQKGKPLIYTGSSGLLEIAVNQGRADTFFKLRRGDFIEFKIS